MSTGEVYSPTTAPNPKSSCFAVPSQLLDKGRFLVKVLEVLLSFVAFVLEEVVNSCISCSPLYFFEFVSCSAFLFSLLLLFLLATTLHRRIGITCWLKVDFVYTSAIALMFLIASIVFAAENSNKTVEKTAVAFGFVATVAFAIDIILLLRSSGFPFKKSEKAELGNCVPPTGAIPEKEMLNTPANAAE